MPSIEQQIAHWRDAGIIDAAQAERILRFEEAEREHAARERVERPGAIEALVYLGLAVAVVGVVTLTGQNWHDVRSWARVASLAVPGVLTAIAGVAMRRAAQPELRRGASVAWVAAVALLAGAVAVIGNEAEWDRQAILLSSAGTATALALAAWVAYPSHLQVLALAGSLLALAVAGGTTPDAYNQTAAGLLMIAFGAAGLALTEKGLLHPRPSARIFAAAGFAFGAFHAGYAQSLVGAERWAEALVFLAGAALVALSLRRASFIYMVAAVAAVFVGLVSFIETHFEQQLGAPLALMLSGALLVAGALLLARFRVRLQGPGGSP